MNSKICPQWTNAVVNKTREKIFMTAIKVSVAVGFCQGELNTKDWNDKNSKEGDNVICAFSTVKSSSFHSGPIFPLTHSCVNLKPLQKFNPYVDLYLWSDMGKFKLRPLQNVHGKKSTKSEPREFTWLYSNGCQDFNP